MFSQQLWMTQLRMKVEQLTNPNLTPEERKSLIDEISQIHENYRLEKLREAEETRDKYDSPLGGAKYQCPNCKKVYPAELLNFIKAKNRKVPGCLTCNIQVYPLGSEKLEKAFRKMGKMTIKVEK